ncbi:alpha/beta hydrolase [Salicibibacter cibarius]|uniref:Alpha/beta hydrolase n=1 Tax=Salicibibacter cibarius TaxID=2743000 RepID=A0A7T6Z3D7_9BACI|nr:alpha/beta hydrolase [Salicibibacter cibarius]QQK76260.1 alpha/beta hydrolase [Salicibibacter cibarius]
MKELLIEVKGIETVYYRVEGRKTPIIFIHGAGADSSKLSWKEVTQRLASQIEHELILVDLPGHGQTGYIDGIEYSQDFYVQFVASFIEALNLKEVILAGISLGAGIALGYCIAHEDRVKQLCLIAPNGLAKKWNYHMLSYHLFVNTPLNLWSYRLMAKSKGLTKQIIKAGLFFDEKNITNDVLNDVFQSVQYKHAGKAFESYQQSEFQGRDGVKTYYTPKLNEIKTPTLFVHGKQDRSVSLKDVKLAHHELKDSQLYIIENARHWPQKEHSMEFCQVFVDFLVE